MGGVRRPDGELHRLGVVVLILATDPVCCQGRGGAVDQLRGVGRGVDAPGQLGDPVALARRYGAEVLANGELQLAGILHVQQKLLLILGEPRDCPRGIQLGPPLVTLDRPLDHLGRLTRRLGQARHGRAILIAVT